jgi:hypothetical protein
MTLIEHPISAFFLAICVLLIAAQICCASPNFLFTANTPADITTALNAMFNQALITAHITN